MTTANTKVKTTSNFAWRTASRILSHFKHGSLTLSYGGNTEVFGNVSAGPQAVATVHDAKVFREMVTGGTVSAAETYMRGLWDTPDLTTVIRLFAANINDDPDQKRFARLSRLTLKIAHWINRNTIHGSKKNIEAHYDLGNDLFKSFLDSSMMYSSAIYPSETATLEEAQQYRLNRICKKLKLTPDNHLLEIGTGWGSMAIHAAKHFGCRVTTTTISEEQFEYAQERIKDEGLEDKITLLKQDYRLLNGQYDRLVSIEMIEAVGHKYLPGYFRKINDLLQEDGIALLQSITMVDQRYDAYKESVDFIRKYIFPGGHLPSISEINSQIAKQTDMTVSHFEDITHHYARTLREWHERFINGYNSLPHDKYTRQFYRMWRYYLSYCEGGFMERAIGTSQIVFSKPKAYQEWVI